MKYEVRARKRNEKEWQCYFSEETVEGIASLASQLGSSYELKISTVGHAIETIDHPHKACMVQDILERTQCVAPIDAPFNVVVYGWVRNANEAIIRWTFDNLIGLFKIDTICVSVDNTGRGRACYEIRVVRK